MTIQEVTNHLYTQEKFRDMATNASVRAYHQNLVNYFMNKLIRLRRGEER